jgi:TetR/AcrR family transcriptional regulator
MQDIAREAGVNQALLHYYFRHKDRLSEAVFRRAAGQLMPRVMQILASDVALADKVAQIVTLEIDQLITTPYLPGYIISELQHHPERAHQLIDMLAGPIASGRARAIDVLRRQLAREARAGHIAPIAAEQFIVNLVSLCIFPFAARPMIMALLGLSDADFVRFIDARRTELPTFFLRALQP